MVGQRVAAVNFRPAAYAMGLMRRVHVFVNPLAGRGRGMAIATRVSAALSIAGYTVESTSVAVETLTDFSADLIIVIGGDGTLRGVVQHLGRLIGLANLPPILPIGLGTANLMQRHLGLRFDQRRIGKDAIAYLAQDRSRAIDVGTVNDQLFLLMAGCGFDAAVVRTVADQRRGPIRKWTYVTPALAEMAAASFPPLSVEVDGKTILNDRPAQVFVGNVSEYGTGFPMLPGADSGDGMLDICILPCDSRLALAIWQTFILRGRHIEHPDSIYLHGRHVRITGRAPVPLQIDGDAAGVTPADIRLLGQQVRFIVA